MTKLFILKPLKKFFLYIFIVLFIFPLMLKAEESKKIYISDKSLNELNALALEQNAEALNELGHIYFKGLKGVDVDKQKGFDFLMQAAKLNHGPAQFFIALIYDGGFLGVTDTYKAAEYYKKSVENGFTPALYSLGHMYIKGQGVSKNIAQGLAYWHLAAKTGDSEAQNALGIFYLNNDDLDKGLHYTKLAVKQNHPNATYNLGILYLKGNGVEKNKKQALKYFNMACQQEKFPLCDKVFNAD